MNRLFRRDELCESLTSSGTRQERDSQNASPRLGSWTPYLRKR